MKKLFDETHPYGEHDRRRTQWYQLENDDPVQFLFASAYDEIMALRQAILDRVSAG